MKKQQYIVFGLNRFGTSVARTLAAAGNEVVAVDQDADRVAQIADDVSYAVQVDVADEDAMSGLGMEHMDGAVIAVASNMEASIVIAMKCKEYNIPQIIATGKNEVHGKVLKKLGVTRVVFPEVEMGARVGKYLTARDFSDWINLSNDYSMVEIAVPKPWINHSMAELGIRTKYGVTVVGIMQNGNVNVEIDPQMPLPENALLILVGANKVLEKIGKLEK